MVGDTTTSTAVPRMATLQDLGKWSGSPAKVRYTESAGRRDRVVGHDRGSLTLSASLLPPGSGSDSPKRSAIR